MVLARGKRNFSETTKRILAERVAYMCCNPMCRRLTIHPLSSQNKPNRLGEAAHIYGIGKRSARFIEDKPDGVISGFDNGIWLCNICHKYVDTEKISPETLISWKQETETYTTTLVMQDTRLRQLRIFCQSYLSALRVLSGLPTSLDHTFNNPLGNSINLTRSFYELDLVMYDNLFIKEAEYIVAIAEDLNHLVGHFVDNHRGTMVNISEWKKKAVRLLMINVMQFSEESYCRYVTQEDERVNYALNKKNDAPQILDLSKSKVAEQLEKEENRHQVKYNNKL